MGGFYYLRVNDAVSVLRLRQSVAQGRPDILIRTRLGNDVHSSKML